MQIRPLEALHHPALLDFFDQSDQGFCYCQYWSFGGDNEAWMTCDPAGHRAALVDRLRAGDVWGVLALEGRRVVGWTRLATTREVEKLGALEPAPPDDAASILCVSVSSDRRGRGIARALVRGAIEEVRARGFAELRAYARWETGLEAGAVWTGPRSLYEAEGFEVVLRGGKRWTFRVDLKRSRSR